MSSSSDGWTRSPNRGKHLHGVQRHKVQFQNGKLLGYLFVMGGGVKGGKVYGN
jgi:hypothetical protein